MVSWKNLFICLLAATSTLSFALRATSASDVAETEAYVVQAQQTITSIATDYGISPEDLARFNHLRVTDRLEVGLVLFVPVGAQLAPQVSQAINGVSTTGSSALQAPQPLGKNQIQGTIATVTAQQTKICSKPFGGQVVFDHVTRDMQLLVIDQTETHYAVLMSDGSTGWVSRLALKLSDTTTVVPRPSSEAPSGTPRQDIVDNAMRYLDTPYKYGGALPDTVDCSLFVQAVFRQFGVNLPRTAADQFQVGAPVLQQNLVAGDRLYFRERGGQSIGHTAIYIGNGRFIHASSNRGRVAIDELTNATYAAIFAGARR